MAKVHKFKRSLPLGEFYIERLPRLVGCQVKDT